MLRHNLSTRPFYNERVIHLVLGLVTAVALAATVFNLWAIFSSSGRGAQLQAVVEQSERRENDLRSQAAKIRASINSRDLDATIAAAEEANALIERRVFSWTELFNHFESTLPDTVRISAVRPRLDRGAGLTISIVVVARSVEGIDTFIENLEKAGAFSGLLSREEFKKEDGTIQATLEGQYVAGAGAARAAVRKAVRQ